jgi:hypothetical protein
MQLKAKLAASAIAGAMAISLAAGVPALASTHASARPSVTGPEVISGTVHGVRALVKKPIIRLRLFGLVKTRSAVNLGGGGGPKKGDQKTLKTPRGNLTVRVTAKPTHSQDLNFNTCRFSFAVNIPLAVVGGKSTGEFAGASGPGAAQVSFSAKVPRFKSGPKKGHCNPKGKPMAKTAVANFLASLVLTLK